MREKSKNRISSWTTAYDLSDSIRLRDHITSANTINRKRHYIVYIMGNACDKNGHQFEIIDNGDHKGPWGGFFFGHKCCGQCDGATKCYGRCNNRCRYLLCQRCGERKDIESWPDPVIAVLQSQHTDCQYHVNGDVYHSIVALVHLHWFDLTLINNIIYWNESYIHVVMMRLFINI